MKKLLLILGLFIALEGYNQDDPFNDLLQIMSVSEEEGLQDVNTIMQGYLNPLMKGVGYGFSNGWYNTGKPHEALGFDITLTSTFIVVPEADFSFSPGELNQVDVIDPLPPEEIPTVFSGDNRPRFRHKITGAEFEGLGGINTQDRLGFSAIPVPLPQIGIGLIKGTELRLRFLPPLNLPDGISANLWGVGIMHDVKQYIPGMKRLPFDMSAFVGYTQAKFSRDVNGDGTKVSDIFVRSATAQGIVSKKLSIVTGYVGFGYSRNFMAFNMMGEYDVDQNPATPGIVDPISISSNSGGAKALAGIRFNFAVITLHFDYTLQEYSSFTGGIGVSIR